MIVERATVLTHDPAVAPLTRQRGRGGGVNGLTCLVRCIKRRLMRYDEQVGLRIRNAMPSNLLTEETG